MQIKIKVNAAGGKIQVRKYMQKYSNKDIFNWIIKANVIKKRKN